MLAWRVHVVDEVLVTGELQRVYYHYLRLKVFDEKGKEQVSTINIEYGNRTVINDISGRTIKADGSIVELQKNSIFKRDVERIAGIKRKATSFSMPGVELGSIVEYRYKEIFDSAAFRYLRLPFSRDLPIRKVTYFVIPLTHLTGYQMYLVPFNVKTSPMKQENDGYSSFSAENIPAFHEETFSPSESNVRPWALLYYRDDDPKKDPDKFWNEEGKRLYKEMKENLKSSNEIKAAAQQAIAGVSAPAEKVTALVAQLHKSVRYMFGPAVTDSERSEILKKMPSDRDRTAAEIFKSGIGMRDEMNLVFTAMATEAGLDARPARVADWNEMAFSPRYTLSYFLRNSDVAVKIGDGWNVYDVSETTVAPGSLPWRQEGMYALITDPKNPVFLQTASLPGERSLRVRAGTFKLSEDGTLEGEVEETYTGHRAEDRRDDLEDMSPSQLEEWLDQHATRMFPGADVSNAKWSGKDDTSEPLTIRYHLKVRNFAQATGRRLLFHSNVFARSQASPFSASVRHNPIQFPYAWKEQDQVTIQLPSGFVLDNADRPADLQVGETGNYKVDIRISPAGLLAVQREFWFGKAGGLIFEVSGYQTLKKVFDEIARRDQHMLALKENK